MKRLAFLLLLLPGTALAQDKPEVVLIPRDVAVAAMNWLAEPNAMVAVKLYAALQACLRNNPFQGSFTRNGDDQCPVVTQMIEARDKELADLRKQLSDAKPK